MCIRSVNKGNKNNVIGGRCTYSRRDRYSHYYVKSQITGSDFSGGEDITAIQGDAVDEDIPRFRPLILTSEANAPAGQALTRAQWEKSHRAGKSVALEYRMYGWRNKNGDLWSPNTYVNIDDDYAQAKGKLLIAEVALESSADSGTLASLKITPPEAYIPSPKATSKSSGGAGFSGWAELKDGV